MPNTNTAADRATLVAKIRELGRALADETMSERDADALARSRAAYQAQLDALDGKVAS